MFDITENGGQIVIRLTRNDSCEILTCPMADGDTGLVPIELGSNDFVMFAVMSRIGRIYLKKILTSADTDEDGNLCLKLSPADTANIPPETYSFYLAYMPNGGEDCYTYAEGQFIVLPTAAYVSQLGGGSDGDNQR